MAEALIYWMDHWMDALRPNEVNAMKKADPDFEDKYNRRLQRGDIIELREDGFWANRGFDRKAYAVIKVPGLELNPLWVEALYEEQISENPKVLKRRRFNVGTNVPFDENNVLVITNTQWAQGFIDKAI